MVWKKQISSKELFPEGRKQLCATLGLNMLAYRVQADWLVTRLHDKQDANYGIM